MANTPNMLSLQIATLLEWKENFEKMKRDISSEEIKLNLDSKEFEKAYDQIKLLTKEIESETGKVVENMRVWQDASDGVLKATVKTKTELGETVTETYAWNKALGDVEASFQKVGQIIDTNDAKQRKSYEDNARKAKELKDKELAEFEKQQKREWESIKNKEIELEKQHHQALRMNEDFNKRKENDNTKYEKLHYQALKVNEEFDRKSAERKEAERRREEQHQRNRIEFAKQYNTLSSKDFNLEKTSLGGQGTKVVGAGTSFENENTKKFYQVVNEGNNVLRTYQMELNKVDSTMKVLSTSTKEASRNQMNLSTEMGIAVKRIAEWAVATALVYGSLRQLQAGVRYVYDLSNALNQIRIVTGDSVEEVNRLAVSYNNLAKEMGTTTKEVALSSVEYYRQGLTQERANERMKATIMYSKISGITMAESTELITSAANGTGEAVGKIIDVYSKLGDSTAAGADEIGRAMSKMGASAKTAGVSFEQSSAWIATISSATRESAETIGNSLKSMMARYTQIKETGFNEEDATKLNQVTKALEKVGISAVDTAGQLRPMEEVVNELGKKWTTLDGNTQKYVATALGGSYQMNRLLTLLNNYPDAMNNYETAMNAGGDANKKFGIYLESNEAKLNKFKATMEGLWQNTFNSEVIGSIIDTGTAIAKFASDVGLANVAIAGLTVALVLLSPAIMKAAQAVAAFNFATLLNPVSLAAVALGTLAVVLYNVFKKAREAKEEFEEFKDAIDDVGDATQKRLKNEKDAVLDLMTPLGDLVELKKLDADQQGRVNAVKQQMIDMYPQLKAHLTDEMKTVGQLVDAYNQYQNTLFKTQRMTVDTELMNQRNRRDRVQREIAGLNKQGYTIENRAKGNYTVLAELAALEDEEKEAKDLISQYTSAQASLKNKDLAFKPMTVTDIPKIGGTTVTGGDDKTQPTLQSAIDREELAKERVDAINAQVQNSDLLIKQLNAEIKILASKKDYTAELEKQAELIKVMENKTVQLGEANKKIASEAATLKSRYKGDYGNMDTWFTVNNEASVTYKEALNEIAAKSEKVLSNTSLSVKERNAENTKLKEQKQNMEDIFKQLQYLKKGWTENRDEIDNNKIAIDGVKSSMEQASEKELADKKKVLEEFEKAQTKMIERIAKAHEKQLKDELDKFKDAQNEKIREIEKTQEAIKRRNEEQDYAKEIKTLTDEKTKLEKERMSAKLDGSIDAQHRIWEIDKELLELQKDIDEESLEHQRKIENDALDDKKDAIREEIRIEEKKYDKLIADARAYEWAKQQIAGAGTESTMKLILDLLGEYDDEFIADATSKGTAWVKAFQAQIALLIPTMGGANNSGGGGGGVFAPSWTTSSGGSGGTEAGGSGAPSNGMTQYAEGTDSAVGGISLVGEKGAELRYIQKDTKILPSHLSKQLLELPSILANISGGTVNQSQFNNQSTPVSLTIENVNVSASSDVDMVNAGRNIAQGFTEDIIRLQARTGQRRSG